ncbi:flagellar export chaperone FlgN [Alteromonas sp. ASW11-36]|uniref:Flagellar export chaperone FlgN n=1 Tax=Alteromonas arenosi TaxID=3055817 RepID=A0ABT7SVZ5_9ALTE|nr:flagellar export chaperone FlgN [Alteromonas sp. ASW11-36]MDM7860179.1 flagellar export chaperone FlgN [Alteromonas sp. ASW11-36]
MATIAEALSDQLHNLKTLQQLLESELHLISSRDAESLMNLLNDKQTTLDAIQQQDELINQLFANEGDDPKSVIANQPAEVQAQLEEAQQLLEQCKFRTSVNEKAVEQGQLKLEHLRHLLVETRARESLTYDRSGKPQGGSLGKGVSA